MLSPVVTDVSTTWVEGKGKSTYLALMICLPLRLSKRQSPLWQPLVGESVGEWGGGREEGSLLVDVDSRTALRRYQHYYIITAALPISLPGSSSSPSKQICTVDDNVTFKISVLVILILDIRSRLTLLLLRWNSSALDLKETFSGIKCLRIFCV